jgi:hypothetical protein
MRLNVTKCLFTHFFLKVYAQCGATDIHGRSVTMQSISSSLKETMNPKVLMKHFYDMLNNNLFNILSLLSLSIYVNPLSSGHYDGCNS